MRYPDYNHIEIETPLGVSPVSGDTLVMARIARELEFGRAIELGSGSGFVSVYLNSLGRHCSAADINSRAVECTWDNARRNRLEITAVHSNLFESIDGQYDLIIFNPPHGHSSRGTAVRSLELVKSLLPKESDLILRLSYPFIRRNRRALIRRFLNEARKRLRPSGGVLMSLYRQELDLLHSWDYSIRGELCSLRFVLLSESAR